MIALADELVSGGGDISITSATGAIVDATSDAASDIRTTGTGEVSLSAATGIGQDQGGSIDVDADALGAVQTGTGGIALNLLNGNDGAVSVAGISATTSGSISVVAGGRLGGTVTFGGDVTTPSG